MNELNMHKKSDKIKWALTGIAFLLVFAMLMGICLQLFGTGKQKPSEWFKKPETEQTTPTTPDNGGESDTLKAAALSCAVPRSMAVATVASSNSVSAGCSLGYYSTEYANADHTFNVDSFREFYNLDYKFAGVNVVGSSGRLLSNVCNGWDGNKTKMVLKYPNPGFTWTCDYMCDYLCPLVYTEYDYHIENVSGSNKTVALCIPYHKNRFENYVNDNRLDYAKDSSLISLTFGGHNPDYIYSDYAVFVMPWTEYSSRCNSSEYPLVFTYDKAVSLPANPVKEGYTFVGWYYDSNYTTAYDGQPIYSDTRLYAKFEINRYTVTFNSDGGSAVASQKVDWNTSATLSTPTRDGYAFKGWFLPNGTQYTSQAIKENTTLTAKWERNRFTVTFNSDGGSTVASQTINLNGTVDIVTPIKTGYKFVGWYMADGKKYENQPVTDDLTLTAHWEVMTFTVTFYVDGEVYETKTVEYGTSLIPVASELNLSVMTVYSANPEFTAESLAKNGVTADLSVTAEEATGAEKVINTVKNNKWQIVGGVAGGVALIAVIAAICGSVKRKKR